MTSTASRVSYRSPFRRIMVLAAALVLGAAARAHDPGLSTAEGVFHGHAFDVTFSFDARDAQYLWMGLHRHEQPAPDPMDARWTEVARAWCELHDGSHPVSPDSIRVTAANHNGIGFSFHYPKLSGEITFTVRALELLPRLHREFVVITDGADRPLVRKFLQADDPSVVFTAPLDQPGPGPDRATASRVFLSFVRLGVEHIWTGVDHLLFLLGLVVVCGRFRSTLRIISCFTIAHSLTLAAATLNLVRVPPQWTECAIAASIAFVGLENLMRGSEPSGREWLTFAFGLIHGLGFASALRDVGLGTNGQGVVLPLLAFNSGVELGQIAVAAIALPILGGLRRTARFVRYGVPAVSSLIAAAGVFWLIERASG